MDIPALLETPRLRLRPPSLDDAGPIFSEYAGDPVATRYLRWRPHASVGTTEAFLRERIAARTDGTSHMWLVTSRAGGQVLGMVGLHPSVHGPELGYVMGTRHWGQGYATEAAGAVVDRVLSLPSLFRVWAVCDVGNLASARVLEKVGMEREGVLRRWSLHPNIDETPRDCICYSKVR